MRAASLALLVVGVVLLLWAAKASDSFNSGISRLFTGSPTNETLLFLIGGLVAITLGIAGLLRGRRRE